MLKLRLIFGVLFIAIMLGIFYLDAFLSAGWHTQRPWHAPPGAVLALVAIALITMGLVEMRRLLAKAKVAISMRIAVVSSLLCVLWPWLGDVSAWMRSDRAHHVNRAWEFVAHAFLTLKPAYVVPTVIAAALVGAFVMHTRNKQVQGAMASAGGTLLAVVYLGVLPGFFFPIALTHGAWLVLGMIAIVKAADIGAYTAGHLFGRHKLIPWLSPGKTVEGFIGGLLFSAGAGVIVATLRTDFWLWQGAVIGLVLGAIGQLGDLVESLLKRDAGVKDSGTVPGFGGLLDLFDSPLLAAPAAYWMLKLLNTGTQPLAQVNTP